jgi:hypothetical protein
MLAMLLQGEPRLVFVSDHCEFVFEWDTNVVCGRSHEQVESTDCVYHDQQTGAVYNLTQLQTNNGYPVSNPSSY